MKKVHFSSPAQIDCADCCVFLRHKYQKQDKTFKHIPSCRQTKTLLSDTKPSTTVFATITAAGHSTTWLMRAATRSTTRIGNECHPEENPKKTRRKRLAVKPFGCTDGETGFLHDCPMWKKSRKPAFFGSCKSATYIL